MSEEHKSIQEASKAAQEISKASGKGIDAVREFGGFIAPLIGGTLEQGIGIFEDKLRYMRWERQARLMKRSIDFMKEIGLENPSRAIPLKFAVPLFQAASLEDDDELQDLWAKLLVNGANAASGVDFKRVYIEILEQISPIEAQILDKIYSIPYEEMAHKGVIAKDLPKEIAIKPEDPGLKMEAPPPEIQLALSNLQRLGCMSTGSSWGGGELFHSVNPTILGKSFVEACTLQPK